MCAGKVGSKGILALRTILNPFSVNNRKNMFVYEDKSGNGSHVFYLRCVLEFVCMCVCVCVCVCVFSCVLGVLCVHGVV